jgi:hypothetical protein
MSARQRQYASSPTIHDPRARTATSSAASVAAATAAGSPPSHAISARAATRYALLDKGATGAVRRSPALASSA